MTANNGQQPVMEKWRIEMSDEERIKSLNGSYIHNCIVQLRAGEKEPIFTMPEEEGESDTFTLNGYAIIPRERYCALVGEEFDGENIKKYDEILKEDD